MDIIREQRATSAHVDENRFADLVDGERHVSGAAHAIGAGGAMSSVDSLMGWSRPDQNHAAAIEAKRAALSAMNALAEFEPVASIGYQSAGRLVIIGGDARVEEAVDALGEQLSIAVLWTGASPAPTVDGIEVVPGTLVSLEGYLGAFVLAFADASGATQGAPFDLVLDLRESPAFAMHQPPQGYFHAADAASFARALAELPDMTGEFEKPKFFAYKESVCAHSRSKKTGCNQCIDICSTRAISADGDKIKVDPHLCMGCGACATVCPSGAMSYQYPRVADRGAQLRALLGAYRQAGGTEKPLILFHNAGDGRDRLAAMAAAGRGLPAHVLPIEVWHVASIGLDILLGAVAYGAGGVTVLSAGSEAPEYAAALQREMTLGDVILNGLGFGGTHFSLIDARDADAACEALWNIGAAETVNTAALFHLSNDKRGTLEFVIDHLIAQARTKPVEIALPAGSLYGRIAVDTGKCTMCLACAGACPESALMDGGDLPQLKFLERNCVQCGLCETTCPENAITLQPRFLLTEARKKEVVLNAAEPFNCISCGKALGTRQMIDNLLGKLAGHSMFQGEGQLKRLQMCADCRVVDMMANPHEMSILTGRPVK